MSERHTFGEGALEFFAADVPSSEDAAALMNLEPRNPFCTKVYAEALGRCGQRPWLLGTKRNGKLVSGCYGFTTSFLLDRVLRIDSLSRVAADKIFWDGLMQFCSEQRVTYLSLQNCASRARIPCLPGDVKRSNLFEYVLDLADAGWERKVAPHHWRNIKRSRQIVVTLRRTTRCQEHGRLIVVSNERRRKLGEKIIGSFEPDLRESALFLEKGVAELFQAVAGGKVLSSVLVLRASKGAYYYTAGNSPEALRLGASHFLVHAIARILHEELIPEFNFGEVPPGTGTSLFFLRFGATAVPREDATLDLASPLRRKLQDITHAFLQAGPALLRQIRGRA